MVSRSVPSDPGGEGVGLALEGHTEDPRRIRWSWYIPDREDFLEPSEKGVDEDGSANRECS